MIIGVIALFAAVALVIMNTAGRNTEGSSPASQGSGTEEVDPNAEGMVNIFYHNQVISQFDPSVDAVYHVEGDYGGLDVEVKDGKWHVTNEECPNHVCANMGWVDINEIIPITCLPNGITIYPAGN